MSLLSQWSRQRPKVPDASPPDQPDEQARQRSLLRRFWKTAGLFWSKEAGSTAWVLSGGLLVIIVLLLGAAYAMNAWNRAIFDGLQNQATPMGWRSCPCSTS